MAARFSRCDYCSRNGSSRGRSRELPSSLQWIGEQLGLLENVVREALTDVESRILESRLPVTVEVQEGGEEIAVPYQRA